MTQHTSIEVEANTVKEAIGKALAMLSAKKENVDIKVLTEGERGLFNMDGAKPARIRATIRKIPTNE